MGEEAVELIIESKDHDEEKFLNEAADLVYHFLVLLQMKTPCFKILLKYSKQAKRIN